VIVETMRRSLFLAYFPMRYALTRTAYRNAYSRGYKIVISFAARNCEISLGSAHRSAVSRLSNRAICSFARLSGSSIFELKYQAWSEQDWFTQRRSTLQIASEISSSAARLH